MYLYYSSMGRKVKTIAVSYETYRALLEFKETSRAKTLDEAIRKLLELSRKAMAREVLEYIRARRLSEEEMKILDGLRRKLREEGVWLRRF